MNFIFTKVFCQISLLTDINLIYLSIYIFIIVSNEKKNMCFLLGTEIISLFRLTLFDFHALQNISIKYFDNIVELNKYITSVKYIG